MSKKMNLFHETQLQSHRQILDFIGILSWQSSFYNYSLFKYSKISPGKKFEPNFHDSNFSRSTCILSSDVPFSKYEP